MKRILYGVLIILLFSQMQSCFWMNEEDESFYYKKSPYYGNEMKINGYYYSAFFEDWISILIYYQNGVVIDGGAVKSLCQLEDDIISGKFYESRKENIESWGVFMVDGFNIVRESIEAIGWTHRISFLYYGEILNDTTIQFYTKKETYSNAKEQKYERLYYFKEFSPKPDSTNVFIR